MNSDTKERLETADIPFLLNVLHGIQIGWTDILKEVPEGKKPSKTRTLHVQLKASLEVFDAVLEKLRERIQEHGICDLSRRKNHVDFAGESSPGGRLLRDLQSGTESVGDLDKLVEGPKGRSPRRS